MMISMARITTLTLNPSVDVLTTTVVGASMWRAWCTAWVDRCKPFGWAAAALASLGTTLCQAIEVANLLDAVQVISLKD